MGLKSRCIVILLQYWYILVFGCMAPLCDENKCSLGCVLSKYDSYSHRIRSNFIDIGDDCVLACVGHVITFIYCYLSDWFTFFCSFYSMALLIRVYDNINITILLGKLVLLLQYIMRKMNYFPCSRTTKLKD